MQRIRRRKKTERFLTFTTSGKNIVKPCGGTLVSMLNGKTNQSFQSLQPSMISRRLSFVVESKFAVASITIRFSAYALSFSVKNHAVPGLFANQKGVARAMPMEHVPSTINRYCQPCRLPSILKHPYAMMPPKAPAMA
jgi:hypothetical protein